MRFWVRHVLLLVLCLVLPAGAALYFDAQREAEQAGLSGATAARLASQAFKQRLTLEAHRSVGQAITLAQTLRDQDAITNLGRGKAEAFTTAKEALAGAAPAGGFAWLVDPAGQILAGSDLDAIPEKPRSILGHPIFEQTQLGYALDGFWTLSGPVVMVAAAPLAVDGKAAGAVLVGRRVDDALAQAMARDIEAQVSLVTGGETIVTTLDDAAARDVVEATKDAVEPVLAGRLAEPLGGASLPLLPVFIDRYAEGLAFSSINVSVPGVPPGALHWVVTVKASQALEDLALRQEVLIGVVFAAFLLALLIGLLNFRTFVTPIERVAAHLSEIQLGRGDLEMPEARVSAPFRRLVRLINMTVQKMPTRAISQISSGVDLSPMPEARSQSGLQLSRPDQVPPPPPVPLPQPVSQAAPPEPSLPPPPAPPPAPEPELPAVPEAVPEPAPEPAPDPISFGNEPSPPPPPAPDDAQDEDIAAAIKALEQGTGPLPPTPEFEEPTPDPAQDALRRSASEIRGRPVSNEMTSPFDIEEGSQFGRRNSQVGGAPSGGVRGGGSFDLGSAGISEDSGAAVDAGDFNPEATVVAPVHEELLAQSAREDLTDAMPAIGSEGDRPDHTVVATVSPDLLAQSAREGTAEVRAMPRSGSQVVRDESLDAQDRAHFKEVYERFIDMRKKCGENTADLAFDRFLAKLTRNRDTLIKKYSCRTVRFQVYEKDGKAALKATPVRAR